MAGVKLTFYALDMSQLQTEGRYDKHIFAPPTPLFLCNLDRNEDTKKSDGEPFLASSLKTLELLQKTFFILD